MDALSSISPYSSNPEARRKARAEAEAFSLNYKDGERPAPKFPTPRPAGSSEHLSALAEACSICCGPAGVDAQRALALIAEEAPAILSAPKIERDARGAPIQALPALACAAIQGEDPEGWIEPLIRIGASFDAKLARAEARSILLDMPAPRGGPLTALHARLEALSIWTLACAEAMHPHSALRAVEKARELSPGAIAPLESELARFADESSMDKPGLSPKARTGAFIEAARSLPGFSNSILPAWTMSTRGADAASMSHEVAQALEPTERLELLLALSGLQGDPARAYRIALSSMMAPAKSAS